MKILWVYGMSQSKDIVDAMRKMGYTVEEYLRVQENSMMNEKEIDDLVTYIKKRKITLLMSVHLIYNLAVAAYYADIKYISVIWDAPYLKAHTPMGKLDNVWYSVFDRKDAEWMKSVGIKHVLYQPLSVSKENQSKWKIKEKLAGEYMCDICFVASLYDENLYDRHFKKLPANLNDYFVSIMEEAAFQWDGVNRIYGKTDSEVLRYAQMVIPDCEFSNPYDIEDVRYFEISYLVRKLANIERVCVLNMLAEAHQVYLYTTSESAWDVLQGVTIGGPIDSEQKAACIYAASKINLNISLKGIEGGTPQRVLDILGVGGFVLTNYCEETAELFQEDKEIVMFRTPEELLEKVDYYLKHDEEREAIARAGHEKVMNCYTYEKKIKELMAWVEADEG